MVGQGRKRRNTSHGPNPNKKMKTFETIAFDPSDPLQPIPEGYETWCRTNEGKVVGCVVLDREKNANGWRYYVHFKACDRRMDGWVKRHRFVFKIEKSLELKLVHNEQKYQLRFYFMFFAKWMKLDVISLGISLKKKYPRIKIIYPAFWRYLVIKSVVMEHF